MKDKTNKYEVWKWSQQEKEYTIFLGKYDTYHEAERAVKKAGDKSWCFIECPPCAKILASNGEIVIAVRAVLWRGRVDYLSYYSLFKYVTREHMGFIIQPDVTSDIIDDGKVIFN